MTSDFCLEQLCSGTIYWNEEKWGDRILKWKVRFWLDKIFYIYKFKVPVRNPRVHIKWAAEYMSMVFRRKVLTVDMNLGNIWTISEIKTMDSDSGHTKKGKAQNQAVRCLDRLSNKQGLRWEVAWEVEETWVRCEHTKQSRKRFQQEGLISTAGVSVGDWKPDWSRLTVSGRWGHENKGGANDSLKKKMLKWQTERSSRWRETWRSRVYFGGAG